MAIVEYLLFWVIGLVAGFIGGLFGIGGGVIIVPSLLFLFYYMGFDHSALMSIAAATSLSTMIVTSFISTTAHVRKKTIEWKNLFKMLPGLFIGCFFGVWLSVSLHSSILAKVFGVVIFILGTYLFFPHLPRFNFGSFSLRKKIVFSVLLGFISSLLGIGGGVIAVPVLLGFQLPFRKATALSAFVTFSIALIATLDYLFVGWSDVLIPYSLGYIYLPAFGLISLGTVISSSIGVRVAYVWPVEILKRVFSVILVLTGLIMFFH